MDRILKAVVGLLYNCDDVICEILGIESEEMYNLSKDECIARIVETKTAEEILKISRRVIGLHEILKSDEVQKMEIELANLLFKKQKLKGKL